MFERISKSLIISEYGNSFTTSGNKIIESFGKNHSTICKHKFDANALREYKISERKERLKKELVYLYQRKAMLENSFFHKIFKKHELKTNMERIEKNKEESNNIDNSWSIEYLPDTQYIIPSERFHEGEEVFIINFFMQPYEPEVNVCKVERVEFSLLDNNVSLSYILNDVNKTEVKYDKSKNLITNYSDKYIFKDKEKALKEMDMLVCEKIGMLTTNLNFMKKKLSEK